MTGEAERIEVDGRTATADDLRVPAMANYGHFTAMQVRGRRARGLALHLARLDTANHELFGTGLDGDLVRHRIRHALGADTADATVRVHAYPSAGGGTSILVRVRPPKDPPGTPRRLRAVTYQRAIPHVKHIGDFGQEYHKRLARRSGYHDALLTAPDGTVSETATANIGFFDGTTVVWPDAPMLAGITMQLLLAGGLPATRRPVRTADLPAFTATFVTNARGVVGVSHLGPVPLPAGTGLVKAVADAYERVPMDPI